MGYGCFGVRCVLFFWLGVLGLGWIVVFIGCCSVVFRGVLVCGWWFVVGFLVRCGWCVVCCRVVLVVRDVGLLLGWCGCWWVGWGSFGCCCLLGGWYRLYSVFGCGCRRWLGYWWVGVLGDVGGWLGVGFVIWLGFCCDCLCVGCGFLLGEGWSRGVGCYWVFGVFVLGLWYNIVIMFISKG